MVFLLLVLDGERRVEVLEVDKVVIVEVIIGNEEDGNTTK